jgi:hypothetical protein
MPEFSKSLCFLTIQGELTDSCQSLGLGKNSRRNASRGNRTRIQLIPIMRYRRVPHAIHFKRILDFGEGQVERPASEGLPPYAIRRRRSGKSASHIRDRLDSIFEVSRWGWYTFFKVPRLEPAHNVRPPQCLSRSICFIATMRLKTLRYDPKEPGRRHRKLR